MTFVMPERYDIELPDASLIDGKRGQRHSRSPSLDAYAGGRSGRVGAATRKGRSTQRVTRPFVTPVQIGISAAALSRALAQPASEAAATMNSVTAPTEARVVVLDIDVSLNRERPAYAWNDYCRSSRAGSLTQISEKAGAPCPI